jgi:hypothetical protein
MLGRHHVKDPTARALALAGCLIAIWFCAGPFPQHQAETQTQLRHEWRQCADVVLVGDSALEWALHPEIIEDELRGGYRVVNFGYLNISLLNDAYMAGAEAVLDPGTPHHTMVINVTSENVSVLSTQNHRFEREARDIAAARRAGHPPAVELDWHDELDLRLRPRGLCGLVWNLCSSGSQQLIGYNGHLPVITSWHDETFRIPEAIDTYSPDEPMFDEPTVEPLVRRVRELRGRGVEVIAYVTADVPAIAALSGPRGYHPAWYEQKLRDAGAVVVDYPADLTTFDGAHLDPRSARRLSHALGQVLAAHLPPRAAAPSGRCPWPLQTGQRRPGPPGQRPPGQP